jgi:hypothetical protein
MAAWPHLTSADLNSLVPTDLGEDEEAMDCLPSVLYSPVAWWELIELTVPLLTVAEFNTKQWCGIYVTLLLNRLARAAGAEDRTFSWLLGIGIHTAMIQRHPHGHEIIAPEVWVQNHKPYHYQLIYSQNPERERVYLLQGNSRLPNGLSGITVRHRSWPEREAMLPLGQRPYRLSYACPFDMTTSDGPHNPY